MAVMTRIPKPLEDGKPETARAWIQANSIWVRQAIEKHEAWLEEAEVAKYQQAYDGFLQSIEDREKSRGDDVNHKLQTNYAKLVIDTVVDYMLGKPIVWTVEDTGGDGDAAADKKLLDEYRQKLLRLMRHENAQRVLAEFLRQGSIAGLSAVISWVDENGQLDFEEFPIQEVVPIFDTKGRLRYALRYYQVELPDETDESRTVERTKVEVYDGRYVSYYIGDETGATFVYDEDEAETGNPVEHRAGRIPVSIFVNGTPASYDKRVKRAGVSDLGGGLFTILEQYAHVMSDKANTVDRMLDQFLALIGVDTDEKEVLFMRKARALSLKAPDSKAQFLAPDQEDKAVENHLDRLLDTIHDMGQIPKMGDTNAATATEIKLKYAPLDIKAGKKELYFIQAVKHFVAVLTDMLNAQRLVEAGVDPDEDDLYGILTGKITPPDDVRLYNPEWVSFTFNRNLPQNFKEIAEIVKNLAGIVPDSYLYELLWFIEDPVAALEEMKKQKADALKANMQAMGFDAEFTSTGDEGGGQGTGDRDNGGGDGNADD
jgi:SPP1 family phage portal protein